MHKHSGLLASSVLVEDARGNDKTVAMDGTRAKFFWGLRFVFRPADGVLVKLSCFVMRGLAHSGRGMVWQRSARGILASLLLDDDEPVLTKRGPTPLWRSIEWVKITVLDWILRGRNAKLHFVFLHLVKFVASLKIPLPPSKETTGVW